jgi:hypothetical protein
MQKLSIPNTNTESETNEYITYFLHQSGKNCPANPFQLMPLVKNGDFSMPIIEQKSIFTNLLENIKNKLYRK